ncbi:MAG: ABC transporter permease [Betaproteobacteria bacterium]
MTTALNRKLLRDAWHLRGQLAACAVVVAVGVASFVAFYSMLHSLAASQQAYYAGWRFADVFASAKRAPLALAARLAAVPGVAAVDARVVVDVNLDLPGLDEPARGRIVSLAPDGNVLNRLHLRRGALPAPGRADQVAVSEAFAAANAFEPGSSFAAVINGRWQRLTVSGIAVSPEYIYEAGPGDLMPDNRRFGVLWMDRQALARAFDMEGAFNDATARLAPGAVQAAVLAEFDRLLAPYGGAGAYGREEHFSHRFISDEIAQNRVQAIVLPAVFLAIGAFLLHMILSRQVALQRAQIGLLKAFGYGERALVAHYLKLALLVMVLAAVLGSALGWWLREVIAQMYAEFYRFPVLVRAATGEAIFFAVLLVGAAAVAAAWDAARRAARLPPAEAMRPEPPPVFGLHAFDRLRALRRLPQGARIVVRNLVRRPWRALVSSTGIALALAISLVAAYFYAAMDLAMQIQFALVQREDVQVTFNDPRGPEALSELARLPGVLRAEPFRSVPVRLRHEHRARQVQLLGLPADGELRWIVDARRVRVPLPPVGLLVNRTLATILDLQVGDEAELEVLDGKRPHLRLPVAALVDEPLGLGLYADAAWLARALGEDRWLSGALLRVQSGATDALYARLKQMPQVAGVAIRAATLQSFYNLLARSFLVLTFINLVFAGTIAFGLVYNGARIALSERCYELATLRVLGFTRAETARLLLGEQALLTAAGIPLGLLFGAALCWFFSRLLQTELYRLPFVLTGGMLWQSVAMVLAAVTLSGAFVAWRARRMDLTAVLKARE